MFWFSRQAKRFLFVQIRVIRGLILRWFFCNMNYPNQWTRMTMNAYKVAPRMTEWEDRMLSILSYPILSTSARRTSWKPSNTARWTASCFPDLPVGIFYHECHEWRRIFYEDEFFDSVLRNAFFIRANSCDSWFNSIGDFLKPELTARMFWFSRQAKQFLFVQIRVIRGLIPSVIFWNLN